MAMGGATLAGKTVIPWALAYSAGTLFVTLLTCTYAASPTSHHWKVGDVAGGALWAGLGEPVPWLRLMGVGMLAVILSTRPQAGKQPSTGSRPPWGSRRLCPRFLGHVFRSRLLVWLTSLEAFSVDAAAEMRLQIVSGATDIFPLCLPLCTSSCVRKWLPLPPLRTSFCHLCPLTLCR